MGGVIHRFLFLPVLLYNKGMLDIKFIRENKEIIQAGAKKKNIAFNVEELVKLDDRRRELTTAVERMRSEQNYWNDKVAGAQGEERKKIITEMTLSKDRREKDEEKLKELMKKWQAMMLLVPNIPDMSVPEGQTEADNKEIRVWGEKPKFDFAPKNHVELMEALDLVDLKKGVEVAGFRGYFLKNEGAEMVFGLWQLAAEFFMSRGFKLMITPSMVRRETLLGTGYLPQGEDDLYKLSDGQYLSGTAEVATMSYFADSVLSEEELPKKALSFSSCFRREAGSHGKDTKGVFRLHEFFKLEQIVICEASHEISVKYHEEITENAERFLQALGLPYRLVANCGGDLGLGQVKKYDIECFVPSEGKYRETHSSSYFHDFQTRRLGIKYRGKDGKTRFAHSLNNTALATPRILISIIENYQQADGSVRVPEALQKYLHGKATISPKKSA
jgi:seryl-tRNA synthetase